ncbi:MAG: galactokinase [Chloroflexi bacterium]|nr:galactokinase [Chloroflexota bacterium]
MAAARPDDIRIVRAPGRVNLIGEHTDYNEGLVLPMAIDREIRIAYIAVDDRRVELTRLDSGERRAFDLDEARAADGTWLDYAAGTAGALIEAGLPVGGLRGIIGADLPENAGLSSSAAIELASAWALLDERAGEVDRSTLARICQRAENRYVGVQSGLMDQFAEACGVAGHALLLDCRSLEWRTVPLPGEVAIVVCHSGSARRLGSSEYNLRRAQCEAAVVALARVDPAVHSLRDVSAELLAAERHHLDPVVARRAEHVVAENERVEMAVGALESGDLAVLGETLWASHESLRRLYEVSSAELDALVEIASEVPGVIGARMTGAGFGGCTVNIVHVGAVDALRDAIMTQYPDRTGLTPMVFPVQAVTGVGRLV